METKHTPGPWRLSETASDAVVCDGDSGNDRPDAVTYYGGHLIAESIFSGANRALIAAAPDLLEALRGLLRCMADDEEYGPDHRVTIARAAIDKATGAAA